MVTNINELKEVSKLIYPYAFIAGGFYKDVESNKEPKDIDVFMVNQKNYNKVVKILEDYENIRGIKSKIATIVGRFEIIKPITVFKRRLWGNPQNVALSFDMSIAQVYIYNGELKIEDENINSDIKNKEFTAYYYAGDEDRTKKRVLRYEKYGYKCKKKIYQSITLYEHFKRDFKFKSKKKTSSTGKTESTGGY